MIVALPKELRPDAKQRRLLAVTIACYATGYPIALGLNQPWGWILVTVGGIFLFWLILVTIRRINGHGEPPESDQL